MLMETQAGKKVKKLASHSDPSIASAAGSVLAAWKEVVKQEQLQTPSPGAWPSCAQALASLCSTGSRLELLCSFWQPAAAGQQ